MVQGAQQATATSVSPAAARAPARQAEDADGAPTDSAPRSGARTMDCGRTSVATPIAMPAAARQAHALAPTSVRAADASAPATASNAAVTPSVISAGVYARSGG